MKRLAFLIIALLPVFAIGDEVYRYVDEQGLVVYTDLPRPGAERVRIALRSPRAPDPAPAAAESSEQAPSPLIAMSSGPSEQEIAAERARNCNVARQLVNSYANARRLYRENADGEREYLSDAELVAARAEAESNVAAWCD